MVAPDVDRKPRNVVVQAAIPLFGSTSDGQTDGQVVAEATVKPSYASVVTQVMPVPTGPRNGTSGGPVPTWGGVGPQHVGAGALVVHGIPTHISIDEIFWHADMLRIEVGQRVVRARWLVRLDRRRGKTPSSLVLYFSGLVPIHGECSGLAVVVASSTVMSLREGLFLWRVPAVVHGDGVVKFLFLFEFPLDAGVWRLPDMALGRIRGYVT